MLFFLSCRDSVVFAFTNSLTSFLAGFVIFSVLGYMAQEHGVSVAEVAESGVWMKQLLNWLGADANPVLLCQNICHNNL